MAKTPSNMLPLGTSAPGFILPDTVSGTEKSFESVAGSKATVVMFICNHCPFVIHVNAELVRLARRYTAEGIGFVAISSNDVENYPQDRPEKMGETAVCLGYPFPYLYDEDQSVARAYDAACTPDFYLFDAGHRLVYRGRLDDSTPGNAQPVTGADLRAAIDALLSGRAQDPDQQPSVGCNIKWKSSN